MKIYLVEVLEDPVLFIYLYGQYLLLFITYKISHLCCQIRLYGFDRWIKLSLLY